MILSAASRLGIVPALILLFSLAVSSAQAQTPPAKTAPKPAAKAPAEPATLSLGNASAASKLLTRDELRQCLQQRGKLGTRLTDMEGARAAMDKERAGLTQEQQQLKTERDQLAGVKPAIDELNAKTKAFQEDVDAWNKRVAEFNEAKDFGNAAEKRRVEIAAQGEALQKRQADLQTERTSVLARGEDAVRVFNARAVAIDGRVADWNERNRKLNDGSETLKGDRETWVIECGDRRYREDDEKAIQSGK